MTSGRRGDLAGIETTSLQALRAWHRAIGLAVGLGVINAGGWGRTHRWTNPPRDPNLIGLLLKTVEPLINASTTVQGANVLNGWLRSAGVRSPHANTTQPSVALRPVIDELLGRHGRAHTLIQRRLVSTDGLGIDQRELGVNDIPQLIWPCALPEHLRRSTKADQRILRAVVSMILVRMCTDAKDWVEAGAALVFPPDKSRGWTMYAFSSRGIRDDLIDGATHVDKNLSSSQREDTWSARGPVRASGHQRWTYASGRPVAGRESAGGRTPPNGESRAHPPCICG